MPASIITRWESGGTELSSSAFVGPFLLSMAILPTPGDIGTVPISFRSR